MPSLCPCAWRPNTWPVSTTALVAEVVMVPEMTPMLHAAHERGLAVVSGREMLIHQIDVIADFLGITV